MEGQLRSNEANVRSVCETNVTNSLTNEKQPTSRVTQDESELPDHLKDIDLSELNAEQRTMTSKLLKEEEEAFARTDEDIGCIPDLQMDVNLSDTTPVQKNYVAVPRPLYPEVKAYIEDLLNSNFIRKSKSSYCSPVVCVRKKDQSLRLCMDYRELSTRT